MLGSGSRGLTMGAQCSINQTLAPPEHLHQYTSSLTGIWAPVQADQRQLRAALCLAGFGPESMHSMRWQRPTASHQQVLHAHCL